MQDDESPFSYAISDDKSQLKIEPHPGDFRYSAAEASRLVMFFANLRAQMLPEVHDKSGQDPVNIQCDRYEVLTSPLDGTGQIYLRIPGFGWSWFHFSKEQCVALAEMLNPPLPPDDAPRH